MSAHPEPPGPFQTVVVERRDAVAEVTLNRPEKLNALNRRLQSELAQALDAIGRDETVRVVILTGAGRAFCAGLDLKDFASSLGMEQESSNASLGVFDTLERMPQTLIAAVNGFAVTGGFELVLACDLILAARSASFADTHAQLGVVPGAGLSQKLSRIIGEPRAMHLSLTGEYLSAEQAEAWGLVSALTEDDALMDEARRIAERIASGEPGVTATMRRLIRNGSRMTLADGLALEQEAHRQWRQGRGFQAADDRRERVFAGGREQAGSPK